ncbi:MAG TPA: hypothetical protein VNO32_42115 [Candidatus Acidoferrum sp.]|jgi:hypothetical protein|nr:hypothetical protein [Candidatus Acidoferrum sp.]
MPCHRPFPDKGTVGQYGTGSASQVVGILHELGHAAESAGLPTVLVDDHEDVQGDPGLGPEDSGSLSLTNSLKIGDARQPNGDGGQDQGAIDDGSGAVAAAAKKRKRP